MKLLNERISDTVYHVTHFDNLRNILSQNKFNLTYAKGGREKRFQTGEKQYYLSTSRSITGQYLLDSVKDTLISHSSLQVSTILELDGQKLSTKYTGRPVNYFYNSNVYAPADETEDRILSKEPFIKNASKYIKTVYIWIPYISEEDIKNWKSSSSVTLFSRTLLTVKRILSLCKSKNIPVKGLYLNVDTGGKDTVRLFTRAWSRPHLSEKEILKKILDYFKILRTTGHSEHMVTPGELGKMSTYTTGAKNSISQSYILNIFLTVSSKSELIRQLDRHFQSTGSELDDIKSRFVDSIDHIVTTIDTEEMKRMRERVEELVNKGRIGAALVYAHTYLAEIKPDIAYTIHQPFSYGIGKGLLGTISFMNYNGDNVNSLKIRKYIRGTMSLIRRAVPGLYQDLDTVLFSKIYPDEDDKVQHAIDIVLENILKKLT